MTGEKFQKYIIVKTREEKKSIFPILRGGVFLTQVLLYFPAAIIRKHTCLRFRFQTLLFRHPKSRRLINGSEEGRYAKCVGYARYEPSRHLPRRRIFRGILSATRIPSSPLGIVNSHASEPEAAFSRLNKSPPSIASRAISIKK